ncbi:PqqD family protein [Mycobacterium conspicuum]|uniref:Uncharacterized protein n=1 Tax=Mycobacterium conspicuum TaxID=44010 RepID=A0A7I7YJF2_9MYCO|nr:PqqD family protein [Mycobacterium conspicuum]BBZ40951.1 hypothetical protein MCNS_40140 [Mycobacterium conspicuum]
MADEKPATAVENETSSAAPITDENLKEFAAHSFTFVKQLVPSEDRTRLCQRALDLSQAFKTVPPDPTLSPFSRCGDFYMEGLLEGLLPEIEQIAQRPLFPTYSYFRVYTAGNSLERHTDRPACEFSVSINLGYRAPAVWPLWVEGPMGARSAALEPGDAVVYRGIECPHWRESFDGEFAAQLFLHYVDQTGPYAEWKFDKRPRLSTMPGAINITQHLRLQPDGVLEFDPDQRVPLNPLWILVLQELQGNCAVPDIVDDAMAQFELSQVEAESEIQSIILWLQKNGLLFVD